MDGTLLPLEVLVAGVYDSTPVCSKLHVSDKYKKKLTPYLVDLSRQNSLEACY
jgi:hypothetical protein